jgi:hypothetical protein
VRVVVYLLLAVNLVYLAWAGWVHAPAPVVEPVKQAEAALAQLSMASEGIPRSDKAPPVASASGPGGSTPGAVPVAAGLADPVSSTPSSRCVSVGPFTDLAPAARAAALLRDRGLKPQQRAEQGDMWEGYWVSIAPESAGAEAKVMKALERAGIKDARVMPEAQDGRRVSVGLFSERDRAEKRAQAVKKLGYTADITERRQPGTVYWVDLEINANERSVPTEGLLSLETAGSRLEIRVCPGSEPASAPATPPPNPRDARPAATTADAGAPRPG